MLANGVPGRILYLLLTNLQELAQLISSQLFDNVEQFFSLERKNHMVRNVQGTESCGYQ